MLSMSILAWAIFSMASAIYRARLIIIGVRIQNKEQQRNDVCSGSNIILECAHIAHITAAMALSVTIRSLT